MTSVGQTVQADFNPGSIVPKYDLKKTFEIKNAQFNRRFVPNKEIKPRMGRFYPKGLLNGCCRGVSSKSSSLSLCGH